MNDQTTSPEDETQQSAPAEQIGSPPDAGAGAADFAAASDEARKRTRMATMVAGGALFALVFTFLGYQLKSGNDPSLSSERTRGAWGQQQGQFQGPPSMQGQQGDDSGDDDHGPDGEDGDSWGDQSQPPQQQQGQDQSGPPMSRAS